MKALIISAILSLLLLLVIGCSTDETSPNLPPEISGVTVFPDSISSADTVKISAEVTDEDGNIDTVELYCYGEEITNFTSPMILEGNNVYAVEIGPFADSVTVNFEIRATDNDGEMSTLSSSFTVGSAPPQMQDLYINEILASNDNVNHDEYGEYDDWFEIYNNSDSPVDIAGYFTSDNMGEPQKYQFPTGSATTIIPAGGFILIWCDDDPQGDPLHTNFKLSSGGEELIISNSIGEEIDSYVFGQQTTDISEGRLPDGSENWDFFSTPTPAASNQ
ncbi:MAG: lamin tail domain-containing protein [Candidatus Cloacimonadota bacterium]|nr:lamin tail domain-containing protein [Candidatus Cloacimonadota bacterium]